MMKNIFLLTIPLLLLFSSCEESIIGRCFSGEANVTRNIVPVEGEVTRLFIQGEFDIYLTYDEEQTIEIEFPENLVDEIGFDYLDGNLTITNKVACKWRKENYAPKVYMSLPQIRRFDILDNATIKCIDTLRHGHSVKFYSFGPGDLDLLVNMNQLNIQGDYVADIFVSGYVNNLSMYFKLHGRFFGQGLDAQNVTVTHNGENDLHINPIQSLKANLENVGNIILYNEPAVMEIHKEGRGEILFAKE